MCSPLQKHKLSQAWCELLDFCRGRPTIIQVNYAALSTLESETPSHIDQSRLRTCTCFTVPCGNRALAGTASVTGSCSLVWTDQPFYGLI